MAFASADDVVAALREAAEFLDQSAPEGAQERFRRAATKGKNLDADGSDFAASRALARRGLQLIGVRIVGGRKKNGEPDDANTANLDLSNFARPISVRLIGCVVQGDVSADRADLVTLDLSGSVIRGGVFATFLNASGSVRLRRTVLTGPADFGGADIKGTFDASDVVIAPKHSPRSTHAYVGERGVLNLALATIGNEMRLRRARIYGGLDMRGCVVRRSLFLDNSILAAPVALLEKLAVEDAKLFAPDLKGLEGARSAAQADVEIAKMIHPQDSRQNPDVARRRELEILRHVSLLDGPGGSELLSRLLGESVRARTCAIRADGAHIYGSIFARASTIGGRFRMKYATIEGGIHLQGARLRSAEAIEQTFQTIRGKCIGMAQHCCGLYDETARAAERLELADGAGYVLDLRETSIRGALDMSIYRRAAHLGKEVRSEIVGAIAIDGARVSGDVDLWGLDARRTDRSGANGSPTLQMQHAHIEGDLDLRMSDGVHGIRAKQCVIGGSIRFADAPAYDLGVAKIRKIEQRASNLADDFVPLPDQEEDVRKFVLHDFELADIRGDGVFLFDRENGPDLKLSLAKVAGKLAILPAKGEIELSPDAVRQMDEEARIGRRPKGKQEWKTSIAYSTKPKASVDLRNAATAVFSHPRSAWPKQDGLVIEGFKYERARDFGPLAPPRRAWSRSTDDRKLNRKTAQWAARIVLGVVLALVLAFATLPSLSAATWVAWEWLATAAGAFNVLALVLLLALLGLRQVMRYLTWPKENRAEPLALAWLGLQRRRVNVFRVRSAVTPLEPYIHAANVLRAAGRVLSANKVELERLRLRRRVLSRRNHLALWIALVFIDGFTRYGFHIVRPFRAAAFAIVLGGIVFHQADRCNLIWPTDAPLAAQTADLPGGQDWWLKDGALLEKLPASDMSAPYPNFVSVLYAVDLVIPFADFGQQARWEVFSQLPKGFTQRAASRQCEINGLAPFLASWLPFAVWTLQIFGWIVCTAIALALVTRIETMIARSEE